MPASAVVQGLAYRADDGCWAQWRYQAIPAQLDQFDPLGFVAQRDTRNAVEESFFLHAAGIGHNQGSVFLQGDHVQITHRIQKAQIVGKLLPARLLSKDGSRSWVQ